MVVIIKLEALCTGNILRLMPTFPKAKNETPSDDRETREICFRNEDFRTKKNVSFSKICIFASDNKLSTSMVRKHAVQLIPYSCE